jgi:hypothetical protein
MTLTERTTSGKSEFHTRMSLIARARDRADVESWRTFYQFYQPLLARYLRNLGLKDQTADDVIQDVFVRLLHSLPTFGLDIKRGRFRSYLWKLTYSALVDQARRVNVRRRAEEEWARRFQNADEAESRKVQQELNQINHQQIGQGLAAGPVGNLFNSLDLLRAARAPQSTRLGHRRRAGYLGQYRLRLRLSCLESGAKAVRRSRGGTGG